MLSLVAASESSVGFTFRQVSLPILTKQPNLTDYWDSYWIVRGLLKSELFDIVNATLQNFMDELTDFGFIPNGGRIYCKL